MIEITCINCGGNFDRSIMYYVCPNCGGYFDIPVFPKIIDQKISKSESGVMRYRNLLGLDNSTVPITLGEGGTPLVKDNHEGLQIFHKMESLNPTGSYKDRGTVVLVNYLKENNISEIIEDSSGNAGASLAAYATRADIKARIYVPESASGPKRKQIEEYGAGLIAVPGPRGNAAAAVKEEADNGAVYASHAFMPMGMLGIGTIAYELFEALGEGIQTVIVPVGHGGLMLGIMRGFETLLASGYISKLPYFVGVQAKLCSPVADYYNNEENTGNYQKSIAEGVNVSDPVRGKLITDFIRNNNGMIVTVEEKSILPAYKELALRGIHVEPTSALTWAALKELPSLGNGPHVLIQTGSGLKYQQ
jgi:threonine synthase